MRHYRLHGIDGLRPKLSTYSAHSGERCYPTRTANSHQAARLPRSMTSAILTKSWFCDTSSIKAARAPCSCMSFRILSLPTRSASLRRGRPPAAFADPAGSTSNVRVKPHHTDLQHPALHRDLPQAPVPLDEGVVHFATFAKYAVAFPWMSRSILTRANSARSRAISICFALTGLLSASVSRPCRRALTQLNKV